MSAVDAVAGDTLERYAAFLRAKATVATVDGFPVDLDEVHSILKERKQEMPSLFDTLAIGEAA